MIRAGSSWPAARLPWSLAALSEDPVIPLEVQIQMVINRFMNSFDLKDWPQMKSTLTDQVVVDYSDLRGEPPKTVTAEEFVESRKAALEHLSTHHLIANYDIGVSGHNAEAKASCMIYRTGGENPFNSHAFYIFSMRANSDTSWKICGIKQKILWNEGDSIIHMGVNNSGAS